MSWRYTAKKGFIIRKGGSKRRDIIDREARKLRSEGYKVRVYEVR